ncbi:MAG: papain-like cysteine protease family protein [Longimicrobiales bacterium]|nr:papain-like cysteine protease family protein [Longimicrobiales bacterium]
MTRSGLAALWGLLALGGPSSILTAQAAPPAVGPERVPFIGQTPLLCGGAAAAMVERYWGTRRVYGDDYAHLVRQHQGGIAAGDLRDELRRNGYDVHVSTGDPEAAFRMVSRGIPPILLLTGGEPALHYVVLVGADPETAWIHDPNFGPARRLARRDLVARWEGSNFLALAARPSRTVETAGPPSPGGVRSSRRPTRGSPRPPPAESGGASPVPPTLDSAMTLLRSGQPEGARRLARPLAGDGGRHGGLARRILATAAYTGGDPLEALRHWNALSDPVIDLVDVRGAEDVRHHVLAARLGLRPRTLLTPDALRLARRRLQAVPAVETSRVDYRPLPDGSVVVQGFVAQRSPWPGPADGIAIAARAIADETIALEAGPLFSGGDRLALHVGWNRAQRRAGATFATASEHLPGIVGVSLDWRRERHRSSSDPGWTEVEERIRGGFQLDDWVAETLALGLGVGMERWRLGLPATDADGTSTARRVGFATLTAAWSPLDGSGVRASGSTWAGSVARFAMATVEIFGDAALGEASRISATTALSVTTSEAPRTVWPGAGTGELRRGLLRGHPLASDGAVGGAGFGPHLVHGTLDARRSFFRLGPLEAGGAIFVDAARVWPADRSGPPRNLVDPGVGLFASTGPREIRLDVARGDDRWVVSARVSPPPPG